MSETENKQSKDRKFKLDFFSKKNLIIFSVTFIAVLLIFNSLLVSVDGLFSGLKYNIYTHDPGTSNIVYLDGIPYVDYGYKENEYIGQQISPTAMVREALDNLTIYYAENTSDSLDFCYKIADWFLNNKIIMSGPHWNNGTQLYYYMWAYNFSVSYPKKYIKGPWFSALAQGHIIDLFEQLYQLTGNQTYRDAAVFSLNAMQIKIEERGLLIIEDTGKFWYPEVAEIYKPESRRYILGGFLHTIQNLASVNNITDSIEMINTISLLINYSIANVKDKIIHYTYNDEWTYYDRLGNPTATNYHIRNTELIGWLFNYTNEPLFYYYWDKWSNTTYDQFPKNFGWYFITYFTETAKYWWFTLLYSLGLTVIAVLVYTFTEFLYQRKTDPRKNKIN